MKLLLDQNLSHRIINSLTEAFPGSTQVSLLGMGEATDITIWEVIEQSHKDAEIWCIELY